MFQDKYVFAQLVSFSNRSKLNRIAAKYNGNKYVKHFTCWNQLLARMFGQLSNRESLRDLIVALDAHHSKSYHLGLGKNVSKSSLARANQNRDYHIFEEYVYYLVNEARQKRVYDISNWMVMSILLIQRRLICAFRYSGGRSFVRKKVVSKYILYTI